MDGLLGTILAGVVVAVIGAFAAYYFGVRQERLKRALEIEKEQHERLFEQQQEQNELRTEALTEIKTQASVVVEDVRSWAENAVASLDPAKLPTTDFWQRGGPEIDKQAELLQKYEEIVQQRDSIAEKMNSLRLYFRPQSPYLSGAQRGLFESFDKEFERRYSPL